MGCFQPLHCYEISICFHFNQTSLVIISNDLYEEKNMALVVLTLLHWSIWLKLPVPTLLSISLIGLKFFKPIETR